MAIQVGDNMVYDSLIHKGNLTIAMYGLTIIKLVYRSTKQYAISDLIEEINKTYDKLEMTLIRPERNDLENAQTLIKLFRQDLDNRDLSFPLLPEHLMNLIYDKKKSIVPNK